MKKFKRLSIAIVVLICFALLMVTFYNKRAVVKTVEIKPIKFYGKIID